METPSTRATSATAGPPTAAQRIDHAVNWLVRHWLLFANLFLGVWVIAPWFAPVFMRAGWDGAGSAVYFVYSFFCHQLPERSWFLFGSNFTLPLAEIQRIGNLSNDMFELRRFIGNADVGWKVAWSDRMVSFYGGWFLFGLVYALVRSRSGGRGLGWNAALLLLVPVILDGVTHGISDLWGIGEGFRETNAWLAALTANALPASFYAGDAWGCFNSLMRLGTGLLAAFATIFFLFPIIDRAARLGAAERAGG